MKFQKLQSWSNTNFWTTANLTIRTSRLMLNMWLCIYIYINSKFSFLFFCNPIHKTKIGLQILGKLLIATHPDQSNYLANQQQVLDFAKSFRNLSKLCKNVGPKPFCWAKAKAACLDFSSFNFNLQGDILSTDSAISSSSKI